MLKEELAQKLNGRQYGKEITRIEEKEAKENGLVVVIGQSDDLIEFKGAIWDDICMYSGGTIYFDKDGVVQNKCDDEDCPYYQEKAKNAKKIKAIWNDTGEPAWSFESSDITDMAKFNIYDGETLYCEGIIFDMADLI